MKTIKISTLLLVSLLVIISLTSLAQGRHRGNGGHPQRGNPTKVIVKKHHRHKKIVVRSPYRPAKIVVYHPYWRPNYEYRRRWVYFPRYNFYWDNWRQSYMFWNGSIWFNQVTPPPAIINVNISNEKNYELNDSEDDIDDVYKANDSHQDSYKPD